MVILKWKKTGRGKRRMLGDNIEEIAARYDLKLLVYFGSYARQKDYDPVKSDIDIAFIARRDLDSNELYNMLADLIIWHRKSEIDLVNLKTASGLLKKAVADEGVVLFEDPPGYFMDIYPYLYKSYYESARFRKMRWETLCQKIKEELGSG